MGTVALNVILERVRQTRHANELTLREARATPVVAERSLDRAMVAGARVFDLVTGQEGVVVASTRENVVVPHRER